MREVSKIQDHKEVEITEPMLCSVTCIFLIILKGPILIHLYMI